MQLARNSLKRNRYQRWQQFLPAPLLILTAVVETCLTVITIGLEFWSMIINIKYSFFFIGFIAAFSFMITSISTFAMG